MIVWVCVLYVCEDLCVDACFLNIPLCGRSLLTLPSPLITQTHLSHFELIAGYIDETLF